MVWPNFPGLGWLSVRRDLMNSPPGLELATCKQFNVTRTDVCKNPKQPSCILGPARPVIYRTEIHHVYLEFIFS